MAGLRREMSKQELLDRLEALYEGPAGAEHYGEGVTQAQHMYQCAALAEQEGAGSELIAAALPSALIIGMWLSPTACRVATCR